MFRNNISIFKSNTDYPPFPYKEDSILKKDILDLLSGLGLSKENPFSEYIEPGKMVLIKPNWVSDKNYLGFSVESLVTHTSLIKYLIDFLALAMDGRGKIIIADGPYQNCNFDNLKKEIKIEETVKMASIKYPHMDIQIEDWRLTMIENLDNSIQQIQSIKDVENNYRLIDLAKESFLEEISKYSQRFRVTKYRPSLLLKHHYFGKHEYLVTKRIFEADFIINLPKMKTHIKAGITGAMKNIIGINGHKEFLPHHIKGSSEEGGDNYKYKNYFRSKYEDFYDYVWENLNNLSSLKKVLYLRVLRTLDALSLIFGKDQIMAGSWPGNDTIWRTTLDLNHILYFELKGKKILNIVDGIIAGEGMGPLKPVPKKVGILIAGENPALVDTIIAKMIGYDPMNIKTVKNALKNKNSKFFENDWEDINVLYSQSGNTRKVKIKDIPNLNFKKPIYWEKE